MNCPYCGKEMEAGYLGSSRQIWWDTEKQTHILSLSERGLFLTKFSLTMSNLRSYRCEDCELLITILKDSDPKAPK